MWENTKKERFSLAYIGAVAAHAGFQVAEPRVDFDSVDGILMGDEGRRPRIEFQVKATSQDVLKESHIAFPLSVKNYDDLRADVVIPRIMIVVVVPEEEAEWLIHSEEELRLRHCGYWLSLQGREETDNKTTVSVTIPRENVFDSKQLSSLMNKMQEGEPL